VRRPAYLTSRSFGKSLLLLLIIIILAAVGLPYCVRAFLSCRVETALFVLLGLLSAAASLTAEHRL